MNTYAVQAYTASDASAEILLMLLVAFVLGTIFGCLICRERRPGSSSKQSVMPLLALAGRTAIPLPGKKEQLPIMQDDLTIIEGVGPKIESILKDNGIFTFELLSRTPTDRIERMLANAGSQYRIHNPKTWPEQAALAHEKRFDELKAFQDGLLGGRDA